MGPRKRAGECWGLTGKNCFDIGLGKDFLTMTLKVQATKTKIKIEITSNTKDSSQQKEVSAKYKGNLQSGRTCLQAIYLING